MDTTYADAGKMSPMEQGVNYRDFIPDDLRGAKVWDSVPDLPTLFKNYVAAQKYIASSVPIPKKGWTDEDWQREIGSKLRPATPADYGIPDDDGYASLAHRLGLTKDQAVGLLQGYVDHQDAVADVQEKADIEARQAASAELRANWGNDYDQNLALAQRTMTQLASPDIVEALATSGLGNNPQVIEMFRKVGARLAEDGIILGAHSGGSTKLDAMNRIGDLTGDKNGPYFDRRHPQHSETVAEVRALFESVYGQEPFRP